MIGLTLGLMDGLNVWLDVSTDVTCALSPRSTRSAERIASVARSVADGVAIAAASGVAFGLAYGTRSAIIHALVFGVGFGLADRYMGLTASVWGRYFIAKAWLALSGRLPWRLMAFLDDASLHTRPAPSGRRRVPVPSRAAARAFGQCSGLALAQALVVFTSAHSQ